MKFIDKNQISNISGFNITLKFVTDDDLPLLCSWRNTDEVRIYMDDTRIVNVDVMRIWLAKVCKSVKAFAWLVHYHNTPIGFFEIKNIDNDNASCECGTFFGKKFIGMGLIFYLALCRETIFKKINIMTVYNKVHKQNTHAIRVHEFLGFLRTGEKGNHYFYIGEYSSRHQRLDKIAHILHCENEWKSQLTSF